MGALNPATILLILQGFEAAINAAPKVAELVIKAKDFIATLFAAGLISKEKQDAMHLRVDSRSAMALAGIIDDGWTVDPDPT
jgi:hypothetical protein